MGAPVAAARGSIAAAAASVGAVSYIDCRLTYQVAEYMGTTPLFANYAYNFQMWQLLLKYLSQTRDFNKLPLANANFPTTPAHLAT